MVKAVRRTNSTQAVLHPFGNPAFTRLPPQAAKVRRDPWLCVPASRPVCLYRGCEAAGLADTSPFERSDGRGETGGENPRNTNQANLICLLNTNLERIW